MVRQEDLSALLWSETLADCALQGHLHGVEETGSTSLIAMHRSVLYARCPALRSRLAQAEAEAQVQKTLPECSFDKTMDAGAKVVIKVDSLLKAEHCQVI